MDIGQVGDESWDQWGQEQHWDEQQGEINSFSFGSGQAGWICEVSRNSEELFRSDNEEDTGFIAAKNKKEAAKENEQSPQCHRLCGQGQSH